MRPVVAAAMVLAACIPAAAHDIAGLRDSLSKMPEMILSNPAQVQFHYVDLSALHALADDEELDAAVLTRAVVGGMLPTYNALLTRGPEAWQEKSFVDMREIRYLAGFGDAPNTITIWGLEDDGAAAGLIAALDAADFEPAGTDGVVGNGVPMAMDPTKMDPADPWRSRVGAATFAAAKGDAVIQAPTPEPFRLLLGDAANAADNAVVSTALAGLEAALGDGLLVQAMLISPSFGLDGIDPALLMTPGADFDALRQKLEAELDAAAMGVPPYFGGLIADMQGEHPSVAISLTYSDCDTAEIAARQMEQRWRETMPDTAQGALKAASVDATNELCAATLTVAGNHEDGVTNPIFQAFFDAYMRRNFTVLQIGKTQ